MGRYFVQHSASMWLCVVTLIPVLVMMQPSIWSLLTVPCMIAGMAVTRWVAQLEGSELERSRHIKSDEHLF